MRVPVGKTLRVGPGDEVHVVARLRPEATLGRLFVFAKEGRNETFSPYTPMVDILVNGQPPILTPLMLRLTTLQPMRELQFNADFDGYVRIFQEVDTVKDALARVKLARKICPSLGWRDWLVRSLPWRPMSV
jgi:hypothetical protein